MWFQVIIFILLIVLYYRYPDNTANKNLNCSHRKRFITISMILLAIQSGFRNVAVGPDTYSYFFDFFDAYRSSWASLFTAFVGNFNGEFMKDPFFAIFMKAFATVFPSYRLFIIFVAALLFTSLGKLLVSYTNTNKEVLIGIALYQCIFYSFLSITGIRQTLATAFLLFSMPFLIQKKYMKFILLFVIAVLLHKSAILFSLLALLALVKNCRWVLLGAFVLFVPMFTLSGSLATYFIMLFGMDQYTMYLEGFEGAGAYYFIALILIINFLVLWRLKDILSYNPMNYLFVNALALAIVFTPLTMIDPSNMRIVQYFSIFTIFLLPQACTSISAKMIRPFAIFMFVFLSFYTLSRNYDYAFFWQDMKLPDNYGTSISVSDDSIKLN